MPSASQILNSPYAHQGYGAISRHYAPKLVASYGKGFKPVGGIGGAGIGIGSEILGGMLKPKEDQPIYGGEFGELTDPYKRRLEGAGPGVLGGMVRGAGQGMQYGGPWGALGGMVAGGVIGAATKNATTAYSDFLPNDARSIVANAYKKYLGRDPEAGVVEEWMRGQGWKPGDKGVGQKHMFEKLAAIKNSEEARRFAGGGSNTGGAGPIQSAYRPAPIHIPSYFLNSPEQIEIANRIRQRSGFNG